MSGLLHNEALLSVPIGGQTSGTSHFGAGKTAINHDFPWSRDDIGDQCILKQRNFVPQPQFSFLETGDLHLVPRSATDQRRYGPVQIPMFDPQQLQPTHDVFPAHPTPTFRQLPHLTF